MNRAILNEYPQVQKTFKVSGVKAEVVYFLNPDTEKAISFQIIHIDAQGVKPFDLETALAEIRVQAKKGWN